MPIAEQKWPELHDEDFLKMFQEELAVYEKDGRSC